MPVRIKAGKYLAVGRVTVRNHLAYVGDFIVRTLFLLLIIYIFTQLWGATYRGEGSEWISGYSYRQIIWYLIFAEALVMAFPSLTAKIEQEVKNGEVAYRLSKPISYLLFHYMSYLGEVVLRWLINLLVGSGLGILLFGLPHFGLGWIGYAVLAIGGITVQFIMNMMLALCAFWLEETRGLEFVYQKLLFTVGGLMLPLEIFPELLQRICSWLPFQTILYFSSRTAVRFEAETMLRMLGIQWIWIVVLAAFMAWIFRKGVQKLNVNGG